MQRACFFIAIAMPLAASGATVPFPASTQQAYNQPDQYWARGAGFLNHFVHWSPAPRPDVSDTTIVIAPPYTTSGPTGSHFAIRPNPISTVTIRPSAVATIDPDLTLITPIAPFDSSHWAVTSPVISIPAITTPVITAPVSGIGALPGTVITFPGSVSNTPTTPGGVISIGGSYTSAGILTVDTGSVFAGSTSYDVPAVPEPASLGLLALAALALGRRR